MNILLASPNNRVGGMARWTKIVFDESLHHNEVAIDVLPEREQNLISFDNKSYIRRVICGVYTYFFYIIDAIRYLRKDNYSVIHICSSASLGLFKDLFLVLISKLFKVKIVLHFHFGRIPDLEKKNNWEWMLLSLAAKIANKNIVMDMKSFHVLERYVQNVAYIPNPLNPEVGDLIETSSNVNRKDKVVLFCGQCYKEKGLFELIDAVMALNNIELRIIGPITDETKKDLINYSSHNERIKILGPYPYKETIKEMCMCSVFALPSYSEGFPNVILESMACGCPIITTDVGAIPEMLDIENGFNNGICVKPREVEGLKNAIQRMLDDREYAIRCGKNAQKRVNELYSMPKVWNQLVNIWNSL